MRTSSRLVLSLNGAYGSPRFAKTPRGRLIVLSLLVTVYCSLTTSAIAQVPGMIHYQGRVVVNGTNFDGTGQFKFALVNNGGAVTYWSNGAATVSVPVSKGLYSVLLGDTTIPNMVAIPVGVFTNSDVRLRVWFNDGVSGLQQFSPDQRLAAVGFGLMAKELDGTSDVRGQRLNIGTGHTLGGMHATIAGGTNNTAAGLYATIAGGRNNSVMGDYTTIGGGSGNVASNFYATVGGGFGNIAANERATVSGGYQNTAGSESATVGGGNLNSASSVGATIGGGVGNTAGNSLATVGGGQLNSASGDTATIDGGFMNLASGFRATVGGGGRHTASGDYTTVGGGYSNTASASTATIGGGSRNTANNENATIAGGVGNTCSYYAAIGGGWNNTASGQYAAVPGGSQNTAAGMYAAVCGGYSNTANGYYSLAAGYQALATNIGAFVWSCDNESTASWGNNTFTVRANGGARFYSFAGTNTGVQLSAGGSAWANLSDRNAKENFEEVDCCRVLELLAAMPVTTWNLKSQPAAIRHIGPMAQEFTAAFSVGEDERFINSSDADGVALAAIKGLYQELQDERARNKLLEQRLAALEQRLNGK